MKTAEPKIIYLQIGEDVDISELKDYEFETNAITWCWERIHSNDIKYISKQSIIGLIDSEIKRYGDIYEKNNYIAGKEYTDMHHLIYRSKEQALTELKQKIEEL